MRILLSILGLSLFSCSGIQSRYHEVKAGETIAQLATRYEVPASRIEAQNRTVLSHGIKPGLKLYIPFEESLTWNADLVSYRAPATYSDSHAEGGAPLAYNLATAHFTWPVSGRVSSRFGHRSGRFHEGVDIVARRGTPVIAARSGHVIYASNRIRGYGNLVIIRHSDSFSTVYAHLNKIGVKKGQFLSRGQILGSVGKTGHATGYHLHFEVRNNRQPVDPLFYLQTRVALNAPKN